MAFLDENLDLKYKHIFNYNHDPVDNLDSNISGSYIDVQVALF